jgi:hypothetical protein
MYFVRLENYHALDNYPGKLAESKHVATLPHIAFRVPTSTVLIFYSQ